MSKAGDFEIRVNRGGYPVWCDVMHNGNRFFQISHKELSDLKYAVEKAEQEAREALPEQLKHEVL